MPSFRNLFNRFLAATESLFDRIRRRFRKPLRRTTGIRIVPYRGFGNGAGLFLKGRVVRNPFEAKVRERESPWRNLRATYRRFLTSEVPGVEVQLRWGESLHIATTDDEGYFVFELEALPEQPKSPMVWHRTELNLVTRTADEPTATFAEILMPPTTARFGVISDIDDTVLVSDVTRRLRMLQLALFRSARTRLPFAGVAAFYRALQKGSSLGEFNPVFYVSSSPWNLYDMLVDFLQHQKIPAGPLLLRDIGVSRTVAAGSPHLAHKSVQIKHIMEMYPTLPFILIGDSGQHDPEIYQQAVMDYPDRILAIYIRDVSQPKRDMAVQTIISSLAVRSVPMFLVPDTLTAAQHAAANGWITADSLSEINH